MTDLSIALNGLSGRLRRFDRVWLTFIGLFLVLGVALPGQALESVEFTLSAFAWIAPFLALSVLLAAWLKAAGADHLIGRTVARAPVPAIVIAAAVGALSPFCSCGVVPLIAALLAAGVPLPAVMAFWIASPLMTPEAFALTAAVINLDFAIAKTVAALAMGLLGGFATLALQRVGGFSDPLRAAVCGGCGSGVTKALPLRWAFWHEPERRAEFGGEAKRTALFLGKWLLLAFAIESLMVAWLPPDVIADHLGGTGWQAIPLAVVVGVPAYLNGFAAIPLVDQLLVMGMAPGAAMAFLVAGGVTSLPAAMAVFALVKRPVFLWYLTIALIGSLLVGFTYQAVSLAGG